jgi:hypothetical protein
MNCRATRSPACAGKPATLDEPSQGARSNADSVHETARRSRGRRKPRPRAGTRFKKNRQFLAKPAGMRYGFSESLIYSARTSHGRRASGAFGEEQGTTREWRGKPLKLLKTDSKIRRLPAGKENRSAYNSRRGGLRNGGAHGPHDSRSRAASQHGSLELLREIESEQPVFALSRDGTSEKGCAKEQLERDLL